MQTSRDFLRDFGIDFPIIQAPMAGGLSTPELAAAVCNAGALGSLGAGYLTPDQIRYEFGRFRALTDKPVAINLFAGGYETGRVVDARPMLEILARIHEELGLPAPALPAVAPNAFPKQLETVLALRPEIFSFTFGVPATDEMKRLKERGIFTMGTATTVDEARALEAAGTDAIVAQGSEAGAHRGTFLRGFEESMVPIRELVPAIRKATSLPVIASGGLMDGRDIAEMISLGACAAQLGTAFLTCPEAGTPEAYRQAILSARSDTTVITRAFSGRAARGLRNAFIEKLHGKEGYILPFSLQNSLTRPMRTAAAKKGDAGYLSLWAGQGVTRARVLPAAGLIRQLAAEMNNAQAARHS
ncbi:MAG TPA: nitronate monooxygenase [Candidatus Acidoferrales bacterium]